MSISASCRPSRLHKPLAGTHHGPIAMDAAEQATRRMMNRIKRRVRYAILWAKLRRDEPPPDVQHRRGGRVSVKTCVDCGRQALIANAKLRAAGWQSWDAGERVYRCPGCVAKRRARKC